MTLQRLPERPDLEQLKRQAKDLLRIARRGDAATLHRFRELPAFAAYSDEELTRASLALHDAQSVIAREHGFPSWKALHARVEELTLDREAAAAAFVEAATGGRSDRAARLLARHPEIGNTDFHAALVLGRADVATRALAAAPHLATAAGGPRGWPPLLYVCHTSSAFCPADSADGLVAVARTLLAAGADPNTRYPWPHHGVHRPALWGAALVTRRPSLVALLLEAGADPDDGVTLPLAACSRETGLLDLLVAHGADPNQPWATDGSPALYAIMAWADESAGIRRLLEHGADPNRACDSNGETAMHAVARRWDANLAAFFAEHGAHLERPRHDGRTPYAVAALSGNRAVAEWLAGRGVSTDIAEVDRLVGACNRGDLAEVEGMLAARPSLRDEISDEHYSAWFQAADRGDALALEAMLACGFGIDRKDEEMGKTALHAAAMGGWPDAVRVLLTRGASVSVHDDEFDAQPLVWAAEGARGGHARSSRDHTEVATLLVEAGSSFEWRSPTDQPAEAVRTILADWRRTLA
jgi:ankyrin repeat protein